MKEFAPLRLLQATLRRGDYVPLFDKYPDILRETITRTVREAPLFLIKGALTAPAVATTVMAPVLKFMTENPPEPALFQTHSTEKHMEFVAFDGQKLFFMSLIGSAGIGIKPRYFDLPSCTMRSLDGAVISTPMDPDDYLNMTCWAYAHVLRWSPEVGTFEYVAAGSTLSAGKRVPIPAVTVVRMPSATVLAEAVLHAQSNFEESIRMSHTFERSTRRDESGRDQAGYKIECSRCVNTEFLPASGQKGSLPQSVINKKFKQKGWEIGRKCVCPTCQQPKTIEATPMKSAPAMPVRPVAIEPPRQMSAADKRKVFRAIDENWDEGKGRYIGAASDQHLADTLNVPRAWVKDVREENFGKTQRNEDLDKALGDAKNLRAEAARNIASAMDLAAKFEKLEQSYLDLIRRLEAVE